MVTHFRSFLSQEKYSIPWDFHLQVLDVLLDDSSSPSHQGINSSPQQDTTSSSQQDTTSSSQQDTTSSSQQDNTSSSQQDNTSSSQQDTNSTSSQHVTTSASSQQVQHVKDDKPKVESKSKASRCLDLQHRYQQGDPSYQWGSDGEYLTFLHKQALLNLQPLFSCFLHSTFALDLFTQYELEEKTLSPCGQVGLDQVLSSRQDANLLLMYCMGTQSHALVSLWLDLEHDIIPLLEVLEVDKYSDEVNQFEVDKISDELNLVEDHHLGVDQQQVNPNKHENEETYLDLWTNVGLMWDKYLSEASPIQVHYAGIEDILEPLQEVISSCKPNVCPTCGSPLHQVEVQDMVGLKQVLLMLQQEVGKHVKPLFVKFTRSIDSMYTRILLRQSFDPLPSFSAILQQHPLPQGIEVHRKPAQGRKVVSHCLGKWGISLLLRICILIIPITTCVS